MRLQNVRVMGPTGLSLPTSIEVDAPGAVDRDASGLILSPGWLDLHAHLRDPGFPAKETLQSGATSAAFGGFTHVVAMANTDPVTDRPEQVRALIARAAGLPIRMSFVAAVTMGLEGQTLTDAVALQRAGAVALSDDGRHLMDLVTLRRALTAAAEAGLPLLIHAQIERLGDGPESEAAAVTQALEALAAVPRARLHVQHVSTRASVDLIRTAKRQGLPVTAEATPHHLALTAAEVVALGPQGNVNPPLRSVDDREALRQALVEGVIDAIATDHAPHDSGAKAAGANGFHGFETAVPVVMGLGLEDRVLYRACVERPREIIGQSIDEEWILIDPAAEWIVDASSFKSRGKNTPFSGRRLRGRIVMTLCRGQVVMERVMQHA
ncbi:MAG: dihydroorotase [Chloroflexi bacterium]|nr:MAG: dihydroorotase [Chloroflexota bacterium]TMD81609.1 MAG: dihydroorotase [Chloroflexota bacterium]